MDFQWSKEQLELKSAAIEFARQKLNTDFHAREADGVFSRELWQECGKFGIQGMPMPEQFGGSAHDVLTTMMVMEALGYACLDQGLLFSLHAHMWAIETPIVRFGTDAQKQRFLP